MPKTKVDYTKAVIYRIYCLDENIKDCYIGLTTDFIRRKYSHKHQTQQNNKRLYSFIAENGGWNNWNIEIIYRFENDENIDKNYCLEKEKNYIAEYVATLNTNKLDKKHYSKEWYYNNIEKIKEKNKKEREIVKDYWANQYDINTNPEWYLNNIKNRRC